MAGRLDELRPAWARIDLSRLATNYQAIAAFAKLPVMPVVKADAYGHGASTVGACLESLGAAMLAVAYPEEGLALRRAGIRVPIVVLTGFAASQLPSLLDAGLVPVVSTPDQLAGVVAIAPKRALGFDVHLKLDTGMSRLGFDAAGFADAATRLLDAGASRLAGVMTHLAGADEDASMTKRQLDRFDAAVAALSARGIRPRWVHAANSAGLAHVRPTHTLVRPGLLLYGLRPRPLSPALEVRPVMSLRARVSLVKEIAPGTPVSYGGRFVARRTTRLATLPIGYADGVPRTREMAETGSVVLAGRRASVAGTVCMDLTMADVTDLPQVAAGDEALVFGDDPDAWELADKAGTNAWQILTSVGSRVPRVFVRDGTFAGIESRYLQDG